MGIIRKSNGHYRLVHLILADLDHGSPENGQASSNKMASTESINSSLKIRLLRN